jgi:hypothetical protein
LLGYFIPCPEKKREVMMGIFDKFSSHRRRDGSSPEKAIAVGSGPEEYKWVARHCPGFEVELQALIHVDGSPYDVLTLSNKKGQKQTVYFDISKFFGKEPSDAEIQAIRKKMEMLLKGRD